MDQFIEYARAVDVQFVPNINGGKPNSTQYIENEQIRDAIHALAPDSDRVKICEVWRKILNVHFPRISRSVDDDRIYHSRPEVFFKIDLCTIAVGPGHISELSYPFFYVNCHNAEHEDSAQYWNEMELQLQRDMILAWSQLQNYQENGMAEGEKKVKGICAALAIGQYVQFYRYSGEGQWASWYHSPERKAFHIWHDGLLIGRHLDDIRIQFEKEFEG